jgi:adenine-specific DNA-methyltransferase
MMVIAVFLPKSANLWRPEGIQRMRTTKTVTKQKATGAHFTPPDLGGFVARRIIRVLRAGRSPKSPLRIMDPSCGDGGLLEAFVSEVPKKQKSHYTLVGIESDSESIEQARENLATSGFRIEMSQFDFLEACESSCQNPDLFSTQPSVLLPAPDVIIANPPYVRTQILGAHRAQLLGAAFGLTGRVDLYHAFLVAMTMTLSPGGVLGVITSNRFLTTKGGTSIREFLSSNYDILEVFDLGDTKFFDAAVLPAVFIGKKKGSKKNGSATIPNFLKVYETLDPPDSSTEKESLVDLLENTTSGYYAAQGRAFEVTTGTLTVPQSSDEPWLMFTDEEREWVRKVEQKAVCRVGDLLKVRVGVKTTADKVFIRNDWSELPKSMRPEDELLRPLYSQADAQRWVAKTDVNELRKVLYTHLVVDGKRKAIDLARYPKAAAYLEAHREVLEGRTYVLKANRQWYEIWVPQNPESWKKPKLVFPDISPEPVFFFDDESCIVDGNCYWIPAEKEGDIPLLFLLQGIANSALMRKYHDLSFSNRLYAGRRRYLTQYIEKYPIPDPRAPESKAIVDIVRKLVLKPSAKVQKQREEKLNHLVLKAFGLG